MYNFDTASRCISGAISYEDLATCFETVAMPHDNQRVEHAPPFAKGSYWIEQVRPELHLTGCDLTYLDDAKVVSAQSPGLFVGMLLDGSHTAFLDGKPVVANRKWVPTIFAAGADVETSSVQLPGQVCRMTGIHIDGDLIRQLAEEADLPGCDPMIRAFHSGFIWQELDGRPELKAALTQLADNPYHGTLGRLYAESRMLAAVLEVASTFRENRHAAPRLTRTNRDRADHAMTIIDHDLANPPSVPELARTVGLSETSLRRSFKAAFGVTITEHLRERRLEVARILLREQRLSIAEIGYRIGFNSPANFSTAYRRKFGHSPKRDLACR